MASWLIALAGVDSRCVALLGASRGYRKPITMASKKFKGKTCVYCADRPSTTADHVFAREFFLPGTNYTPLKVPACAICNGDKSRLEHYLTAVLPFGGRHAHASANLSGQVPKRLARNVRLHNVLANHAETVWVKENGEILVPTTAIPLDFAQVEHLIRYIVKALAWLHFKVQLTHEHFMMVLALSKAGEQLFEQKFFSLNVAKRIVSDVGDGTFMYEGVQGVDNASITAWRFALYGGLVLGGDPRFPGEGSSIIGAFSGPRRVQHMAELRMRFGPPSLA